MTKSLPIEWGEAQALLTEAERWGIVVHEKPDGDALGSGAALAGLGRKLGKRVLWGGADPFPAGYRFLPESDVYRLIANGHDLFRTVDLVVCLDTSNRDRSISAMEERPSGLPLLVIDHHRDNERFGDVNIVYPEASSTAELIWDLALQSGWPLGEAESLALYMGLVTDCGRFSFSSTTPFSHLMAADLLGRGLRPDEVNRLIYNNRSLAALHLWGRVFSRALAVADGKALVSWIGLDDFSETGATTDETEGLANELMSLQGVTFAALLTEQPPLTRISLRSCGPFAAGDLARRWSGGGHRQAAGCRLEMPLSEALQLVIREIEALYE